MAVYPEYPKPQDRFDLRLVPKNTLEVNMAHYDLLRKVDLYVLPKLAKDKRPAAEFWRKDNPTILRSRAEAQVWQQREDISGWCVPTGSRSKRVIVVDYDTSAITQSGYDANHLYQQQQELCPTQFVIGTPAHGVHCYYRIPDDLPLPGNSSPYYKGLDVRGEGGQVVSLGGYNRYTGKKAVSKGVADGHCAEYFLLPDGKYDEIPLANVALLKWLYDPPVSAAAEIVKTESYGYSEAAQRRVALHYSKDSSEQVQRVQELLSYILSKWNSGKTYDNWQQVWMAAWMGCWGAQEVLHTFLDHPNIVWQDAEDGKRHFRHAWMNYAPRIDRSGNRLSGVPEDATIITIATLYHLAREAGWLATTGYEIPKGWLSQQIDVDRVTDWVTSLDTSPEIVLLMSQTGSGKTFALKTLWKLLEEPDTVIFVPSIKLATELAMTLEKVHGLPVTLYRDPETGRTLSSKKLAAAKILVTTLQTFAAKVHSRGAPMSRYGLVYCEESDQLIQDFARGGGGRYSSHVSRREAEQGFACLRDALDNSGHVWFVDATMTRVTYELAASINQSRSMEVVHNRRVAKKAPVVFLSEVGEALRIVVEALLEGKKVAAVCDTAGMAEDVEAVVKQFESLANKETLVITKHTERTAQVIKFMEDVNAGAAMYDLVCYNSVMGSGVSIDRVKVDVVVQICTYLSPRANLQLLNRYRQQEKVYCYYRLGESLGRPTSSEIAKEAVAKAVLEGELISFQVAKRYDDAELRGHLTSLAVGDENQQARAPRAFYRSLLRADGRLVVDLDAMGVPTIVRAKLSEVRRIKREQKERLAITWRDTPPVDRRRPALSTYTAFQVAQGEVHADIERLLWGNVPRPEEATNEEIYETTMTFQDTAFALTAFVHQDAAVRKAERFLADRTKALTTLNNDITLVQVVSTTRELWVDLTEELTPEKLQERAGTFLAELAAKKEAYDLVMTKPREKYEAVRERTKLVTEAAIGKDGKPMLDPETGEPIQVVKTVLANDSPEMLALAYSKILLAKIGLKQRGKTGKMEKGVRPYVYHIANINMARRFLQWRLGEDIEIVLSSQAVAARIAERADIILKFKAMSDRDRDRVLTLMAEKGTTDIVAAVNVVLGGDDTW